MITSPIATRLVGLGGAAAVAFALAAQAAPSAVPTGAVHTDNLATLRTIERAAAQGQQIAYREIGGRLVIDSKISSLRTASIDLPAPDTAN